MDMVNKDLIDKIRGSLIGGAIGDALGYPVEFISYGEIQNAYGENGITRFDLSPFWIENSEHTGKALVSDDTQMTLFTANGLLNAEKKGIPFIDGLERAYLEWLYTQTGQPTEWTHECWITSITELHARRAPGNTCITSLTGISCHNSPINNSKGCGGVMRIAPIPLYAATNGSMSITDSDKLAGEAAKITHHHPLGYIPAALLAHIIYRLLQDSNPSRKSFENYIIEGLEQIKDLYAVSKTSLRKMDELVRLALTLSVNDLDDFTNIDHVGGGWVAEETLAIALYCTHRYYYSFEKAIIASVNHGGDSDSTGAVTGNIIGAIVGYNMIPQFYKDNLEFHDVILKISDEIAMTTDMNNKEFNNDELIVKLTIDGTEYENVEVTVTNPNKTIREQIESIVRVFELPTSNQYVLGHMLENEGPVVFEFEDEEGNEQSLLDYNIMDGDNLHLASVPLYGCPMPDDGEADSPVKDERGGYDGKDKNRKPFWRHILYGCWL